MSRRGMAIVMVAVVLVLVGAYFVVRDAPGVPGMSIGEPAGRAPEGVRVRVEVLNATRRRGLARRATMHLRDRGYDVVATGTSRELRDSTLILDRTGHPEWSRAVAAAMGGATVESRPDTSRYVDVTVLIGSAWRPPTEPFYP